MFNTTRHESKSRQRLFIFRIETKDVFDASIICEIAATLETDIHLSGQAICNLLAAQGKWILDII